MNARLLLLTLTLGGLPHSFAQAPPTETEPNPMSDEVREAIKKFKASRAGEEPASNEPATDPATPGPVTEPPAPAATEPSPPPTSAKPAPADDADPASPPPAPPSADSTAPEAPAPTPTPESPEPEASLSVKVEKLQTGQGGVDPKSVKLRAPFPAKPLAAIPAGWHLEAPPTAPPFIREIELDPGAAITLTIRPHLLVPDADGATAFSIAEPGFDPTLGYRQTRTVGAVLTSSVQQLDDDSKQLGDAIDQLEQLLGALPQPQPAPKPAAKPKR
jgi:hypothetical protein